MLAVLRCTYFLQTRQQLQHDSHWQVVESPRFLYWCIDAQNKGQQNCLTCFTSQKMPASIPLPWGVLFRFLCWSAMYQTAKAYRTCDAMQCVPMLCLSSPWQRYSASYHWRYSVKIMFVPLSVVNLRENICKRVVQPRLGWCFHRFSASAVISCRLQVSMRLTCLWVGDHHGNCVVLLFLSLLLSSRISIKLHDSIIGVWLTPCMCAVMPSTKVSDEVCSKLVPPQAH